MLHQLKFLVIIKVIILMNVLKYHPQHLMQFQKHLLFGLQRFLEKIMIFMHVVGFYLIMNQF